MRRLPFLALLLLFLSCAQKDQLQPRSSNVLISSSREVKIGRAVAEEVEREFPPYDEPRLQAYVDEVGQRLASVSDRNDIAYHFKVLDSPLPNAFAAPGGYIYITRGMLGVMDDESELAGVLGHEIGHVTARHGAKRIQAGMIAQVAMVALAVLAGDVVSADFLRGVNAATNLIFLGYSRGDEHQSDLLGAKYLHRAGYDMRGMVGVMEGLMELQTRSPASVEQYFQSHPLTRDRIKHIEEWIPRIPGEDVWGGVRPGGDPLRNPERYQRLAAPFAIYPGSDEIASLVENFRIGIIRKHLDAVLTTVDDSYRDSRGRSKNDLRDDLSALFARARSVQYKVEGIETSPARTSGRANYKYRLELVLADGSRAVETGRVEMELLRPEPHVWRITSIREITEGG